MVKALNARGGFVEGLTTPAENRGFFALDWNFRETRCIGVYPLESIHDSAGGGEG